MPGDASPPGPVAGPRASSACIGAPIGLGSRPVSPALRPLLDELRHWALPGGLLVGAAFGWIHLAPESPLLAEIVDGYPYVVYGAGALLAWRLRRSRVVAALGAVALVALVPELGEPSTASAARVLLATVALPLSWLRLSFLPDRPLFSRRGLAAVGVVALFLGAALAIAAFRPDWAARLLEARPGLDGLPLALRPALLLPVALAAGVLAVAAVRHRPVERGLFWSLAAVELALLAGPGGTAGGAYLLTAGLVLGTAVVEGSYAEAYHDELTGLPGRRALTHTLERMGRSYTVAMVDVDHFKRFNDRHGHDVGDQVLRMVAARLDRAPGGGRAFRYGGEEFTLLYPGKDREEAREHLEEVRRSVQDARFVLRRPGRTGKGPSSRGGKKKKSSRSERTLSVTVSIGAASPREPGEDPFQVLDRADQALYRAKKKGRNRLEG